MPGMTDFAVSDEAFDDSTHILVPCGEIDALTAPQLGRRLIAIADQGKDVVVDLSDVTFMDSTGIGVLLNGLRRLTSRSASLVLVCPTARILRPFKVTGLVGRLRIFPTREAALGELAAA